MLRTKNLNRLLSQNTSVLVSSIIIFTPAGTLLAYSQPSDSKTLRTQASLVANVWSTYTNLVAQNSGAISDDRSTTASFSSIEGVSGGRLATLTLELTGGSLYVVEIQPRLLLCLISRPRGASLLETAASIATSLADETVTISGHTSTAAQPMPASEGATASAGAATIPSIEVEGVPPSSTKQTVASFQAPLSPRPGSGSSSILGGGADGTVGVMKAQAESLARYLQKELEDFEVPDSM